MAKRPVKARAKTAALPQAFAPIIESKPQATPEPREEAPKRAASAALHVGAVPAQAGPLRAGVIERGELHGAELRDAIHAAQAARALLAGKLARGEALSVEERAAYGRALALVPRAHRAELYR